MAVEARVHGGYVPTQGGPITEDYHLAMRGRPEAHEQRMGCPFWDSRGEIEREIQEGIDAGLVLNYKDGDYPQHCSRCFLVAKPGSTARRLVVDYGELNKTTLNHSGSIPNMASTLKKIGSCRYKTKMDKRSGFWQVDLMPNTQELLAFIILRGGCSSARSCPLAWPTHPLLSNS